MLRPNCESCLRQHRDNWIYAWDDAERETDIHIYPVYFRLFCTRPVTHPWHFQTKNSHVHEQTYPRNTRNHESWSIPTYNIQSISDCFVLGLFLMHPWPFQTKNSHVHEVRKHRHHNIYWISVRKEEKRKKMLQLWRSTIFKRYPNPTWSKGSSYQKNQILKRLRYWHHSLPPSWPHFLVSLGTPRLKNGFGQGSMNMIIWDIMHCKAIIEICLENRCLLEL